MYLNYALVKDVKFPNRGHWSDAGIDFYIPKFSEEFLDDLKGINEELTLSSKKDKEKFFYIGVNDNVTVPSGVKVEIPPGYMGLFLNKSGVASKRNIVMGAQVIDPYYSGEVHLDLHNVGNRPAKIREGDKITQMVLVPISHCQLSLTDEENLYLDYTSEEFRNEKGFGSTG